MDEEYREYKRRNRTPSQKTAKSKELFTQKLVRQLIFSLMLLLCVCVFKSFSPTEAIVKKAFTYQVDTSGITNTLSKILQSAEKLQNTEEGKTNETAEAAQNP